MLGLIDEVKSWSEYWREYELNGLSLRIPNEWGTIAKRGNEIKVIDLQIIC